MIKFFTKERKEPKEIHGRMNAVYVDISPSYYHVKFWSKQFKCGRKLIKNDSRSGWPVEASSKEMCQKVEDMILQDHYIKVSAIAFELGISAGTVSSIIHSVLMMSKVGSQRVP